MNTFKKCTALALIALVSSAFNFASGQAFGQGTFYIPPEADIITVKWEHENPPNTLLDGFRVYVRLSDKLMLDSTQVKELDVTRDAFPDSVWPDSMCIAVDAWNKYGRSLMSQPAYVLFREPPPFRPIDLDRNDLKVYASGAHDMNNAAGYESLRLIWDESFAPHQVGRVEIPVETMAGQYEISLSLLGAEMIVEIGDSRAVLDISGSPVLKEYKFEVVLPQGEHVIRLYPDKHTGFVEWFRMKTLGEQRLPPERPGKISIEWR